MSPRAELQRPVSTLVSAGRWVIVVILLGNLAFSVLGWVEVGWAQPHVLLAQLVACMACVTLLWRPQLGLIIGCIPLGMTLAMGNLDADAVVCFMAACVMAYGGHLWQIAALVGVELAYAMLRGLLLESFAEAVVAYSLVVSLGTALGLVLRFLVARLRRGEEKLLFLAEDVADIRASERLRLADELRIVVSARLTQAWEAHSGAKQAQVPELRSALEAVRVACVDAVTRVRALVGMLREEPVADGSDESLAAPKATAVVARTAKELHEQGMQVRLALDPSVDERNLVTQLTIVRLAEWIGAAAETLRPRLVRLSVDAPRGGTVVEAELETHRTIDDEHLGEFNRLGERVAALGGSLRLSPSLRGIWVSLDLSEAFTSDEPVLPRRAKPTLGSILRPYALPIAVVAMVLWTVVHQDFGWPLLWAALGYLSVLLLAWSPLVGAVPAVVSVVGMITTSQVTVLALMAVVLMGSWQVTAMRDHRWTTGLGLTAMLGILLLGLNQSNRSVELVVAVSSLFLGLIGSTIARQYQGARVRQSQQVTVLVAAVDRARLEERNLLARELHDVLAHHLSVILLQCMAYADSEDIDELRCAMERIGKSLKAAEDELALLTNVMSEGETGDVAAIVRPTTVGEHLLETLEGEHFRAQLNIDPAADDLPAITQRTLTRVMQEGVTNILRYAKRGGLCRINLVMDSDKVMLSVRSEMPPTKRGSQLSLGLGLTGIRERVDLSGGKFHAGPDGREWVVRVQLPSGDREAESLGGPSAYTR